MTFHDKRIGKLFNHNIAIFESEVEVKRKGKIIQYSAVKNTILNSINKKHWQSCAKWWQNYYFMRFFLIVVWWDIDIFFGPSPPAASPQFQIYTMNFFDKEKIISIWWFLSPLVLLPAFSAWCTIAIRMKLNVNRRHDGIFFLYENDIKHFTVQNVQRRLFVFVILIYGRF